MSIVLNGRETDYLAGSTVADVVADICDSDRGVAVARSREIIPRSTWSQVELAHGDVLEVLTAAAGG